MCVADQALASGSSISVIEILRGVSPLLGTAQIVPAGISGLCAAVTTGILLSRIPRYIMAVALLAFCVGNVLLSTMPVALMYWLQAFLAIVIAPRGMTMSFPAATIILSDFMPI